VSGAAQPASGNGAGLVTFEVTPAQALQVVSANQSGTLYLTLHSLAADAPGGSGAAGSANGQ